MMMIDNSSCHLLKLLAAGGCALAAAALLTPAASARCTLAKFAGTTASCGGTMLLLLRLPSSLPLLPFLCVAAVALLARLPLRCCFRLLLRALLLCSVCEL
jgi:hypothetical protein